MTRNARHGWVPPFLMGLLLPVIISELSRIWRRRTPRPRHTAHTYNQTIVRLLGVVVPYSAGLQHQHQVGRTRVREVKGCHYAQAGCSRLVTGTCVTRFCFAVAVCPEALIRMNAWSSQLGGQQSAKQGKWWRCARSLGYNFLDFACPSLLNILSLDHVETSSGNSRGAIANTETTASTIKYPHDVRGRWKRNICPQEADMAWNMCFGWFTGCCLLMFCFVWCCQTTTWWCVRQNIALLSKYYNSTCFATLWWMFAGRLWLKFNLYVSWFKRFWFFVTMAAASLLLLPIEAKQNLTLYVGMMGCKYAKLQGGEGVQPMANCARWGLKVTPVEAGT